MQQSSSTDHRPPATPRHVLGLIFIIVFIDLLGFAIVLPLLPRYAERFQASGLEIGLLFASFSAMQFLFAPFWGRLSDRIGRRPALLAGLIGSVIFYALFGVATIVESLALMFVSRIGAGICGATISTAQAYIADATGVRDRAKGMAIIGAAFGVGFTFGPILGSITLPHAPVEGGLEPLNPLPGFLASGLSLIAFVLALLKLPESLRRDIAPPKRTLLDMTALRSAISTPSVGALLLLVFVSTFAFASFEATLSLLTGHALGYGDRGNFWFFTYIGLTLTIVQGGIVRRIAPRVGEPALVMSGLLLLGVGLWLVNVAAGHSSSAGMLAVIPLVVTGMSFVTPSTYALISRRSDPARQGEILGLNQSVAAMARILGPLCGNVLFDYGMRLPYQVGAVLIVPTILLAVRALRAGSDWPQSEPQEAPLVDAVAEASAQE